jgi:hypothetical protein
MHLAISASIGVQEQWCLQWKLFHMRKCQFNVNWRKKKVPRDYDIPDLRQSILGKRRRDQEWCQNRFHGQKNHAKNPKIQSWKFTHQVDSKEQKATEEAPKVWTENAHLQTLAGKETLKYHHRLRATFFLLSGFKRQASAAY